ncbi:MAG: phosphoribosyltransferase family protein [Patescibacteria group bacterium]
MLSQQEIKDIFAESEAIITDDHFVYAKKADGWYHGSAYVNKDAIYPYTNSVSQLCGQIALYFARFEVATVVGPTVGAVNLSQWTTYWLNNTLAGWLNNTLSGGIRSITRAICADEEDVLTEQEFPCDMPNVCPKKPPISLEFESRGLVRIETSAFNGNLAVKKIKYTAKTGTRRVIKRGYDKYVKGKRCLIVEDIINTGITVTKTRDAILEAGGEVIGVACLCNRSGEKVNAGTLRVQELFSLLNVNMEMFREEDCPICKEKGRGSVRLDLGKGKEFLTRLGLKPGDK